jgi:hypothetical protein
MVRLLVTARKVFNNRNFLATGMCSIRGISITIILSSVKDVYNNKIAFNDRPVFNVRNIFNDTTVFKDKIVSHNMNVLGNKNAFNYKSASRT